MMNNRLDNIYELPDNLPVPLNDGRCDHLLYADLKSVSLQSTDDLYIDISRLTGITVLYCYPRTGSPNLEPPQGWNKIPGARGCTPQAISFNELHSDFQNKGIRVFGLSSQTNQYQKELASRLKLKFSLLSDSELFFTNSLDLPTFEIEGMTLIKRCTLIIKDGVIKKVFYPVFPPTMNASESLKWISENLL